MRLFPDSLFGRLLFGLLSIVAVTILIIVLLILRDRREFVIWGDGRADVIATVVDVTQRIASVQFDDRSAEVQRVARELLQARTEDRLPPVPLPNISSVISVYAKRLADALGDEFDVRVVAARRSEPDLFMTGPRMLGPGRIRPPADGIADPTPAPADDPVSLNTATMPVDLMRRPLIPGGLDILVTLPDGDELAIRTDMPRGPPPTMNATFRELGLLTVFLAAGLLFVTRAITRPLSELAQASESIGRGRRHGSIVERGAREIRETTRAFNTMQERLQRYLDSRAGTLAAMSHDLRTPLTRLRLRLENVDDSKVREQCKRDLEEMNRLIDGSLGFFRALNEDNSESELEIIDLNKLCRELIVEFAEMGHAIRIQRTKVATVAARPQALKRCISNLLTNAVRYGEHVTLSIDCANDVTVRIRDDGPGIPPEDLDRVFQPFYRVDSSRNRETGGVGLGLAIAKDIAQSHGGTLTLHNCSPGLEAVLSLPRSMN